MLFRLPKLPLLLAQRLLLPLLLLLQFSSRMLPARVVAPLPMILDLLPELRPSTASSAEPLLARASAAAPMLALPLLDVLPHAALAHPFRGQAPPARPASSTMGLR